ncbi:energy transducer TonB [Cyanothece sp. BG0011]|uniref:energy transducer TonB n=1 Tax=Cyanothece sp. BG0011 TaxID=2082950 RepID=UPI000D1E394D|nr:energy transducer TonB [Cyanothece sp. BG0011]
MASSYFQSAPIRIFNSNVIPTLVSVGLHGLALFLLVPYVTNLPTAESEGTDQGPINVPLIELNPNEQSRLPEQNSALSSMPDFPNSTLGDLPMLDSPSLESSLPNNFNNLPSPPALPPLPPLNFNNDYSRIPVELPPRRSFPSPPPISTRLPSPPSPSLQDPTPKTPPIPDAEIPEQRVDPRQTIDFGDPTPAKPNNPLFQGPNNPVNNPQISRNSNNDPTRQDEIIRNLVQDIQEGADNLTYNPQGTTKQEANLKDAQWQAQTGVTLKPNQMITIKAAYPKAACNLKLEGSPTYNVLVNDNGQLRKPPFLTRPSGYGLLDNQGLQAVRARSFPQSTRVKVVFQYDPNICGTGVAEGERNNQPQTSPSPTPKTPAPATPQNQTPSTPQEPKTPTRTPENSTNSTPKPPTEPKPAGTPQTPQNQTPPAPQEPKSPSPTPENPINSTPKPPTEPKPAETPQTPQNQTPPAPQEPKSPSPTPENPINSTPKPPTESKPSETPQTPQNQTPPAPAESKKPTQSPKTPSEGKKTPNPPADTKVEVEGPAAPPVGRK